MQQLLPLIVIICYNAYNAYAREDIAGYITTCAPQGPLGDCGFGIWNDNTCECNCIKPYCFDELYQSCVAQGSCRNPFEGCTPYLNCPYYYNPAGNCDSSPDIYPGVYTVFWDADSCCRANFPSEVSTCVAAAVDTSEPTLAPTSLAPVPVSKELLSIPPIPMKLLNLTAPLQQLEEDQRRALEEIIINTTTNEIESELNAIIKSMKVSTSANLEDGYKEFSFELHPMVIIPADTTNSVQDIRASILNILNNQNSNIASQLEELFGQDIYLSIPSIHSSDDVEDSNNLLTIVLASVLSVVLVLMCVGLMIRRRGKRRNESSTMQIVAADNNQIVAVYDKSAGSSPPQHHTQTANESRASFRAHEADDGYDGGNSSYNMNSAFNESDFSFPTTDSSKEEGNSVLGLLYYEGPDSSESEEDGHQSRAASRASRRSRRSNISKKSKPAGKSRASATEKSRKSNRRFPLQKLDESTEYRHSKKRDPDGFDGSTIMSGSQSRQGSTFVYRGGSLSPTNAPSIAGDSLVSDTYPPMRPAGVESVASAAAAPSIATIHSTKRACKGSMTRDPPGYDSYSKRNSRGMSMRTDAYSVSVNSTGEDTSDLCNQPEVKF
ncbi:hypothetical protein QTG54_005359 [Skeletonema marinoi]|uniref:Uncharacterized protein n=1 Tax=Skeletonema marinoi TaxID=267567 RepID=A0AAD8YCR8_9STRA|nr:hypothetical protein QTG54_005359 [Skeletonema marinoi]